MWIGLVLLSNVLATILAATDKIVCFHGSWSVYRTGAGKFSVDDIDPSLCTHLIYSFAGVNSDGTVCLLDSWNDIDLGSLAKFANLKAQNSNLKTLIAVGGWNEGSETFSAVASDASLRATFIESVVDFLQTYDFDGLNLDWEYPAQRGGSTADIVNFSTMLSEFRSVFDLHGYLLTASVAAVESSVDISYDVPEVSQHLHFITVMTYDLHGSWDAVTGQNSPLYASSIDITDYQKTLNVDACIRGWITRGADPAKLILGIATYGRTFTLSNSNNPILGAATSGAGTAGPYTSESGMLGYNEICEELEAGGWTIVWDDEQKVPFAYSGNQWVGYDNPESAVIKVEYAKSMGLGGIMVWSVETDDFKGVSGTANPILNAIKAAVESTSSNSTSDTSTTATTTTTVTEASSTNYICSSVGYIRDSSNCSIFYYCQANGNSFTAIAFQCPAGLYYDLSSNICNYPSEVDC